MSWNTIVGRWVFFEDWLEVTREEQLNIVLNQTGIERAQVTFFIIHTEMGHLKQTKVLHAD